MPVRPTVRWMRFSMNSAAAALSTQRMRLRCEVSIRRKAGERAVMKPADDIPGIGRFAILLDPQGAAFAIIKLENPQS